MKNNITIAYILTFAKNTWFWLGIWVFYYLSFTNYAGIGLIETVLIVTTTLAEIPTGAVADLFGKKKTLILAFLLEAIGAYMMAFAPNYTTILWSVFIMCVGGAFYSGTLDALVFDSLKSDGKSDNFDKVISNLGSISLIAPAICSIIGGLVYGFDPRLPFILNAIGYTLGLIATLFLVEPKVDTEKFSFNTFTAQTRSGLFELFKNTDIRFQTILMLSIGFVVVISSEMVDGFLSFEFGFTDKQMGVLWSVIFILSAIASQLTPAINKLFGLKKSLFLVGFVMAITFIISPYIGLILGGLSLIMRSSLQGIFGNLSSVVINNNTESKFRATTISTFNMIKNIPYLLMAYFIGSVSDIISAKNVSMYLGLSLIFLLLISLFRSKRNATI
ncbi:MFS transporter [Candidatus Dojkabacteria bacterium]|nr:MFS transporter [Candidatus Dojkabacteria bacterium]